MSLYSKRGVSAQKEEVHAAIKGLDAGLFPKAFCKLYPDWLGGDKEWINIMHADGAGTKSILAYLYWKETGDISVWRGIAQDAIVMNLDDLICTGIFTGILFSSTIDRNKKRIPGEVLKEIIQGTQEFFDSMQSFGVKIHYLGGETADVGDLVRTIAVNGTMTARWPSSKVITNEKIRPGQVIIGLASYGKAKYEMEYNSGIGSNGLTSARHDMLDKQYGKNYPETFDASLEREVTYIGQHKLTDEVTIDDKMYKIGKLLLSPTRTFAPLIKKILEEQFDAIKGLVHCSGGGQTKCLKYMPDNTRIIKNNLFEPPLIFQLIQKSSGSDEQEMYQVFNMGTRLEIYTNEKSVQAILNIARDFNIDARIIGKVESGNNQLTITTKSSQLTYS